MNGVLTIKRHRIFTIVAVVMAVLLVWFILRGWIRNTAIPAYYSMRYAGQLNDIIRDQNMKLHYPLHALGMQSTGDYPAACTLDSAHGITTSAYCIATQTGFRRIRSATELTAFSQELQTEHTLLIANGWQGGLETKLTPPPAVLTSPIGWYNYSVIVKGYYCTLQFGSLGIGGIDGRGISGTLFCSRVGHFL